ncbi:MAG: DUF1499 domain-containing protein [Gammaproteobacteria bacterium]|nr:DUF1499 domain-containing protein [Gammaproteobacteria bacterium]
MKILLYSVIGLLVIIGLYFLGLSVSSRKPPDLGMLNDQLRTCPATPNCVSSERQDTEAYIEPLKVTATTNDAWNEAWKNAKQAVTENGGEVVTERADYFHARFVTPLMRYIDDVELRIDKDNQLIHIRSASRIGHSDFGANRKRVTKIRMTYLEKSE